MTIPPIEVEKSLGILFLYFSNNAAGAWPTLSNSVYKASLKTGEIPIDLKRVIITPIYKGGYRNLPKNCLSCSPYMTFNKNTWKNISKKYPPFPLKVSKNEPQATFVFFWILPLPANGASQQDIREIGKMKQFWCYLLNFSKAFDKVDHGILLNKLKK